MSRDRGIYEKVPGSGVWWIRYADQHGTIRRESVGTKTLAREVLATRRLEVKEGRFFPKSGRREPRLDAWIEEYLERAAGKLRDGRHRRAQLEAWAGALGSRKLRALTAGDVERFLGKLRAKGKKPATLNRYHAALKRCLNVALADGLIDTNPAARVKLERENNARVRWLTEDEERRLLAELPPLEADMVRFAIHTGMRQSEQFGLRWRDLGVGGETAWIPRSKSGEGRWVRLNAVAREVLRARGLVLGGVAQLVSGVRVFALDCTLDTLVRGRFQRAAARAGIEDLRWHDLRHTFASRLVMAGVALRTVQELLGHKTPMMTLRYAHLSPGHLQDAVDVLASQEKSSKDQGARATDTGTDTGPRGS